MDAEYDPCPRQMPSGRPCGRPRYHRGACGVVDPVLIETYQAYAAHLRAIAVTMTRKQLREAIEFHRLAQRVLTGELNGR